MSYKPLADEKLQQSADQFYRHWADMRAYLGMGDDKAAKRSARQMDTVLDVLDTQDRVDVMMQAQRMAYASVQLESVPKPEQSKSPPPRKTKGKTIVEVLTGIPKPRKSKVAPKTPKSKKKPA